jgi:hypothetical protein
MMPKHLSIYNVLRAKVSLYSFHLANAAHHEKDKAAYLSLLCERHFILKVLTPLIALSASSKDGQVIVL